MAWVYILKCSDHSFYTGSTFNLKKRISEHQDGTGGDYTKKRRPIILVYCEELSSRKEAFLRERQIKSWSRKKKEALIKSDWQELRKLARPPTKLRTGTSTKLRTSTSTQLRTRASKKIGVGSEDQGIG